LCLTADQINNSVRIPNLFFKGLDSEVNHRVRAEVRRKEISSVAAVAMVRTPARWAS
jgi:hypothetical protein